jgi:hypothetical protein
MKEMNSDLLMQLNDTVRMCYAALDDSTGASNAAQLLKFVPVMNGRFLCPY